MTLADSHKIPTDEECVNVIQEMLTFDDQLSEWEYEFVHNNEKTMQFTSKMKSVIIGFAKEYDLKSFK